MQTLADIDKVLNEDGVILFPTDTIWGLGCRIDKLDAVKRIFAVKKRDFNKPFPILVNSIQMLKAYVEAIHPRVETLLGFHTYPLTVIYPKAKNLQPLLVHESGSIAIRLVKDEFCVQLIEKAGVPLVATSANYSGKNSPSNFSEVDTNLFKEVDLVCKYKQNDLSKGEPSVIAKYDLEGNLDFIRT